MNYLLGWVTVVLSLFAIAAVPVSPAASFLESLGIDAETSWGAAKWVVVIGMWVLIFAGRARWDRRENSEWRRRNGIARTVAPARWGRKRPAAGQAAR